MVSVVGAKEKVLSCVRLCDDVITVVSSPLE